MDKDFSDLNVEGREDGSKKVVGQWTRGFQSLQIDGNSLSFNGSNDDWNASVPIGFCQNQGISTRLILTVGEPKNFQSDFFHTQNKINDDILNNGVWFRIK